jgi:putative transposase
MKPSNIIVGKHGETLVHLGGIILIIWIEPIFRNHDPRSGEKAIMRGPKPVPVILTDEQRDALHALIRRHLTPQQVVVRGQIILDAAEGRSNLAIARSRQVSLEMVRLWRDRWMLFQPIPLAELSLDERLRDAPRSGKKPRITPEQICAMVAVACEAPSQSGRPITHWTHREIADEMIKRGIVEQISPRHAARILKKSGPQTPLGSPLVELGTGRPVRHQGYRRLPVVPRRAGLG